MNLDDLVTIKKVAVSPFLLTKIHQRIVAMEANSMPKKFVWVTTFAFVLIFGWNVFLVYSHQNKPNGIQSLAQSLALTPNNSLYE